MMDRGIGLVQDLRRDAEEMRGRSPHVRVHGDAGHPARQRPPRGGGAGAAAGQGALGRGADGAALHAAARRRGHGDAAGARAGGRHGRLRAPRLPRRAGGPGPRGRAAAGGHGGRRAVVRRAQHGGHPGRDPQRRRRGALSPHHRALRRPRAARDGAGAFQGRRRGGGAAAGEGVERPRDGAARRGGAGAGADEARPWPWGRC